MSQPKQEEELELNQVNAPYSNNPPPLLNYYFKIFSFC